MLRQTGEELQRAGVYAVKGAARIWLRKVARGLQDRPGEVAGAGQPSRREAKQGLVGRSEKKLLPRGKRAGPPHCTRAKKGSPRDPLRGVEVVLWS